MLCFIRIYRECMIILLRDLSSVIKHVIGISTVIRNSFGP